MTQLDTLQSHLTTTRFTLLMVLGLATAMIALPLPVQADAEGEREALARLVHELQALEPVIREAEAQAPYEARIRFQYDWLRADLRRVVQGIQDHLDAPRAVPRTVEPLSGDYRR